MTAPASYRTFTRVAGGLAALAIASLALPIGVAAADEGGDVDVVNTETVQVYTDASGEVQEQRIYEQLALLGTGSVSFDNPIGPGGLRNLDGFSGFDVSDGVQRVETEVDGAEHLRSVSDYEGELPLDLAIEYRLDGETVQPGALVGQSGELEVTYTVENVTGEQREISYPDGNGGTITETVDVPLPMVGSLSTTLPSSFTEVKSGAANMAGDGQGGTKLSFTMTLLPPIGSATATFGYSATIKDAVVPPASITALPVDPMQSPTFASAAESYQGGADTGIELTAGAQEIDANLLKIRDGAAELLTGLVQLHEGSQELSAGLQGEAAPGAEELAAGARDLRDGLGQIDDGAGDLAVGAEKLSGGTGDALSGTQRLENGLNQISGGLDQLAAGDGLPAAAEGIKELQDGVGLILAGLGETSQPKTLIGGLHALELGLGDAADGVGQLAAGMDQLRGDKALGLARGGVDLVKEGLDESLAAGGSLDQLVGGLNAVKANFCATHPAPTPCNGLVDQLIAGVEAPDEGSRAKLRKASDGLALVSGGLGDAIGTLTQLAPAQCEALQAAGTPTLRCGLAALAAGLADAKGGAGDLKQGAVDLKGGVKQVDGGLDELATGVTKAVTGVLALSNGASDAHEGSGDLSDGLSQIDGGASELSAGAGRLAAGTGDASDGSGRLADGAGDLASGLGDAADGSGQLADGLRQAREAAPGLPQGAERLSEEGMSQLVRAGKGTAKDYGKLYATVAAGSERAQNGTMAFGAPDDARGLMAYSFEIKGEDGEGSRNVARGVGALVLGGLGLGAVALRRRFI